MKHILFGREEEEDVLREEERVGRAEGGVLTSTREAALRRAQVAEELRERLVSSTDV